jgi:hypothetical protein
MTPPEVSVSLTVRWTPKEPGTGILPTVMAIFTEAMQNIPASVDSATLDVYLEHPADAPEAHQ